MRSCGARRLAPNLVGSRARPTRSPWRAPGGRVTENNVGFRSMVDQATLLVSSRGATSTHYRRNASRWTSGTWLQLRVGKAIVPSRIGNARCSDGRGIWLRSPIRAIGSEIRRLLTGHPAGGHAQARLGKQRPMTWLATREPTDGLRKCAARPRLGVMVARLDLNVPSRDSTRAESEPIISVGATTKDVPGMR